MKAVGICGSDVHYLKVWLNFSSIAYATIPLIIVICVLYFFFPSIYWLIHLALDGLLGLCKK